MFAASFALHALVLIAMPKQQVRRFVPPSFEMTTYVPPPTKLEPPKPVMKRVVGRAVAPRKTEPFAPKLEVAGPSTESTSPVGTFVLPTGTSTFGPMKSASSLPSTPGTGFAPSGTADTEPVLLGEIKVPYPAEAQRNDVSGTVRMQVTVDAFGTVTTVKVLAGPGYGLDEAARDAMLRFRFRPATKNGEAVGSTFTYAYTFELE
ncbi:MAG: TonB family protein [Archangium sp.]